MPSPLSISFRSFARANLSAQSAEPLSLAATPIVALLLPGAWPAIAGALVSRAGASVAFCVQALVIGRSVVGQRKRVPAPK